MAKSKFTSARESSQTVSFLLVECITVDLTVVLSALWF